MDTEEVWASSQRWNGDGSGHGDGKSLSTGLYTKV